MEITDRVHVHGRTCWWDHLQCRWVCASVVAASAPAPASDPGAVPAPAPG
jgi:hypothetical protein